MNHNSNYGRYAIAAALVLVAIAIAFLGWVILTKDFCCSCAQVAPVSLEVRADQAALNTATPTSSTISKIDPTATPTGIDEKPEEPTPTKAVPTATPVVPTPTSVPTDEPTSVPTEDPASTATPGSDQDKEKCNNGVGNGEDCDPKGLVGKEQGENDDDAGAQECGGTGNPCNQGGGFNDNDTTNSSTDKPEEDHGNNNSGDKDAKNPKKK